MLYLALALFTAAIVAVDQLTKYLAAAHLVGRTITLIPGWLLGGSASIWSRIVFTLVGVAAVCGIPGLFTDETGE